MSEKLKIVYAVYHNVNSEARSMEFLQCCQKIGHVEFISYAYPKNVESVTAHVINKNNPFALFSFIKKAKKVLNKSNYHL